MRNALRITTTFQLSVYEVWETVAPSETESRKEKATNAPALSVCGLRAERGWRLYDLSNVSGGSMSTAASVEKGRLPKLNNALRIALAFGVSVHEIWKLPVKGVDQDLIQ